MTIIVIAQNEKKTMCDKLYDKTTFKKTNSNIIEMGIIQPKITKFGLFGILIFEIIKKDISLIK